MLRATLAAADEPTPPGPANSDAAFAAATAKRVDPFDAGQPTDPLVKLHPTLRIAADRLAIHGPVVAAQHAPIVTPTADLRIRVDVRFDRLDAGTLADLTALGFEPSALSTAWLRATGTVPAARLEDLAALTAVGRVKPDYPPMRRAGAVTSQGDAATEADSARAQFSLTGQGVRVGALSDSCAVLSGSIIGGSNSGSFLTGGTIINTSSQASGDLPASIVNIQDINPSGGMASSVIDEGRAMLEIVHDLAPGAELFFATAFGGETGFATNIGRLADAGCRVIVDDVIYLSEPMFQDGIIAQAVDEVVAEGVLFFSSAGNNGDDSYESVYRDSDPADTADGPPPSFDDFHDFDAGVGVDPLLGMTVAAGGYVYAVLQWNEPFGGTLGPGASSDFDFYVYSADGSTVSLAESSFNDSIGDDPLEIVLIDNTGSGSSRSFTLGIDLHTGDGALLKIVFLGSGFSVNQHQTFSPTVFGHAAAAGAVAVAAEFYGEVGSGNVTAPAGVENVEAFSSLGPAMIYFNAAGAPLGSPQTRAKPDLTAPDGANTSFFGSDIGFDADAFPNFFGTSAAAPHAAAVAALLVEALDDRGAAIVPAQVYQQMQNTCVDIESAGVDALSGAGRIDAQQLLALLENGDFDDDGDVDLTDFLTFENCFAGPGTSPPGGCDAADLDFDGDVDLSDFAVFQRAFTG